MKKQHYRAAGGVVVDGGKVLLLQRPSRDEIRLPKGHIDPGESPPETACREVTEESGYADLEIIAELGEQRVEFEYKDAHVSRDEFYFLMRLHSPRQIVRDPHEFQFTPVWVSWEEALETITYEAEREWLRRARKTQEQGDTVA
jgi:8-oxo-dGTP pyrophosphatase MutT (NUDIX family)